MNNAMKNRNLCMNYIKQSYKLKDECHFILFLLTAEYANTPTQLNNIASALLQRKSKCFLPNR